MMNARVTCSLKNCFELYRMGDYEKSGGYYYLNENGNLNKSPQGIK